MTTPEQAARRWGVPIADVVEFARAQREAGRREALLKAADAILPDHGGSELVATMDVRELLLDMADDPLKGADPEAGIHE